MGSASPITRLGSRIAYSNPWMTVREDQIAWADGTTGVFGVLVKPDFAVVLPRENDGFWLVEQFRYPTQERSWEFPMGAWPPGHSGGTPEDLARAELGEETGMSADSWEHLGLLDAASGHSTAHFDVYLATGLHYGDPRREASEADMVQRFVSDTELSEMIRSGLLLNAQSLAALMLFRECLARSDE
jgi:8-oxo-dGTP pyrophosphatase MutT (NUDIX family)